MATMHLSPHHYQHPAPTSSPFPKKTTTHGPTNPSSLEIPPASSGAFTSITANESESSVPMARRPNPIASSIRKDSSSSAPIQPGPDIAMTKTITPRISVTYTPTLEAPGVNRGASTPQPRCRIGGFSQPPSSIKVHALARPIASCTLTLQRHTTSKAPKRCLGNKPRRPATKQRPNQSTDSARPDSPKKKAWQSKNVQRPCTSLYPSPLPGARRILKSSS